MMAGIGLGLVVEVQELHSQISLRVRYQLQRFQALHLLDNGVMFLEAPYLTAAH
jgi:hypothetical protein